MAISCIFDRDISPDPNFHTPLMIATKVLRGHLGHEVVTSVDEFFAKKMSSSKEKCIIDVVMRYGFTSNMPVLRLTS